MLCVVNITDSAYDKFLYVLIIADGVIKRVIFIKHSINLRDNVDKSDDWLKKRNLPFFSVDF